VREAELTAQCDHLQEELKRNREEKSQLGTMTRQLQVGNI
jgi:predicted nuclease with TOPRIM domain